jgi:hypothetical protein
VQRTHEGAGRVPVGLQLHPPSSKANLESAESRIFAGQRRNTATSSATGAGAHGYSERQLQKDRADSVDSAAAGNGQAPEATPAGHAVMRSIRYCDLTLRERAVSR